MLMRITLLLLAHEGLLMGESATGEPGGLRAVQHAWEGHDIGPV